MTSPLSVHTTRHFDRSLKKFAKRHPDLADRYAEAIDILGADPQNLSRAHNIRNLEGIQPGEGQYRLRLGRWRFRYDILVTSCGSSNAVSDARRPTAKIDIACGLVACQGPVSSLTHCAMRNGRASGP